MEELIEIVAYALLTFACIAVTEKLLALLYKLKLLLIITVILLCCNLPLLAVFFFGADILYWHFGHSDSKYF